MCRRTAFWISLSFGLALVGCQGGRSAGAPPLVSKVAVEVTPLDENARADELYLLSGTSRIAVGDNAGEVLVGGFKKPDRAVTATRLPPGLDDTFRFTGWESTERSVGLISRNRTVLLAFESQENISQEKCDKAISVYGKLFGLPSRDIKRPHSHYYFWEQGKVRMMVCTTVDSRGVVSMSSAIGVLPLMDKFRMEPNQAEKDSGEAELRLNRVSGS